MDLLLINPRTELPDISKQFFREPPNGILQLYTTCKLAGFSVEFIDLSIEKMKLLEKKVNEEPLLIGITCLTNTYPEAIRIGEFVHELSPQSRIIMGGPHASFKAEEVLKENSWLNFVAIGEAESSLPSIIKEVQDNVKIVRTPGIAWKENERISVNLPQSPTDLNQLPLILREDFQKPEYKVASVIINRGCPFKCSFCVRQRLFPGVRI
ncbi:MAG: B12-binding domain-containing radical SAM protein, partial [Candidatus Helarchaeales archaeon]